MSIPVEKPKKSRSLTVTLTIVFLTLSVAVLLTASIIQMVLNFQTQQQTIASEQQLIAQDAANTVAGFVQEKFKILETAVKLGDLASVSKLDQKNSLEGLLGLDRAFRQLVLLNAQDQELVKVSRISQAAAEKFVGRIDSDILNQVKQGDRYISSIYIDELSSEPIVLMAIPVIDIFGDIQGTLLVEVNLKFMWDLVSALEIGQTGQAYVVDKQGNLIAFSDSTRVLGGENIGHLSEVDEFIHNSTTVDETGAGISRGIDGTFIVGTYVPLGIPDWAVVTELPVKEAYQPVVKGVTYSAIFIGIMAVVAGLIVVFVTRRLTVPLLNLTQTSTRIAAGEMELQAALEGPTEVIRLATAFNSMTAQLHESIDSLEQRVASRTQHLETLATLSERLSAILDFELLLTELVNQVKEVFGFYHAHVYILDKDRRDLVMTAGAGQAGEAMKAKGHHISLDTFTSLVAQSARSGEIVWVNNVRESENWLPNPFLPDTYSEMAVPIILENQVVGVLDVQEDKVAGLDEGDASLLRSLANQVAVAIRNARLFAEVETALAAAHTAQEKYIREAWQKIKTEQQGTEYQYHRPGTQLLDETVVAQLEQEAMARSQPAVVTVNNSEQIEAVAIAGKNEHLQDSESETQAQSALVAPIRLQNQTIGTIQLVEMEDRRQWDNLELALVQAVADQIAQAAENLRLFEETRQRAGREHTMRQITEHIRAATNLEELIKIAAEELGQHFSADYALVELDIGEEKL